MSLNIVREVVSTSIDSMLIVVAGLFFGSMANRAIQVALDRTKLEGLAATKLLRDLTETELVSTSSRSYRHLVISAKTPLFGSG